MSDDQTPALEAGEEVVRTEAEQAEAAEAPESTEGQVETPPADGEEGENPEAPKEEKKSASQLRRERRRAEMERMRESEALAIAERDKAQAELARLKSAQAGQPPKEGDFESYDEYQAALSAYKVEQALDARQERDIQDRLKEQETVLEGVSKDREAELAQNWMDQVVEARTRYQDFDEVVMKPSHSELPITAVMAQVLAASDSGADVAYHLGTHPQEAARIARMSDLEAAVEIGRLESRLSAPKPKIQSSAPEPINPVNPKARASAKDPGDMSPSEYRAWREKGGTF